MVRHVTTSDEEAAPASVRVKREKVVAKIKKESVKRAQRRVEDDSDDEERSQNDEEQAHEGSPKGHKRSRINKKGDSRPSTEPHDSDDEQGSGDDEDEVPRAIKTQPRDVDGFIPGSIVRIQLKNFVTYDYTEFFPGPYLNMLIGPNGTGKSSVACAICLGLNFPPSVLGRANEISLFVKKGENTGYIEIELKGLSGEPNLVIRRNLNANNKTSSFTLNGQSTTGKEVSLRMAKLGVQVGNLCSFLPQDKVSEFAAMSPQQLLRETQRAAGNENLTSWHDTLISSGKEIRGLEEKMTGEVDSLQQMKQRNDAIEREVEMWRERQRIEQQISLLEVLKIVQEYREIKVAFNEAKGHQRKAHERVIRLEQKNKPAHDYVKKLRGQENAIMTERDKKKKVSQTHFQSLEKKWNESNTLETQSEDLHGKLENIKKDEKARQANIAKWENQAKKLKEQSLVEVKLEKDEDLKAMLADMASEVEDVRNRKGETEAAIKVKIDSRAALESRAGHLERQILDLKSEAGRQLQNLERWDKDTADVVKWLRKNGDKFKLPILEPPVLTLKVPDKRFATAVEGCFNTFQLRTFVAQCHEDYNLFNRLVQDGDRTFGRKVRVTAWYRDPQQVAVPPPPMNADELREHRFEGYALDFVECPDELRWFLTADINLHRTAVALDARSVDVNRVMRFLANAPGNGANFITGRTMNQVGKSRYGRKAVQNMTRDIRDARSLNSVSVDTDRIARLNNELNEIRQDMENGDTEIGPLKDKLADISAEEKDIYARSNDIKARRKKIADEASKLEKLKIQITQAENKVKQLKAHPPPETEKAKLKKQILAVAQKRALITKDYVKLARGITQSMQEVTQLGLKQIQTKADLVALNAMCERKEQKLMKAKVEHQRLQKLLDEAKKSANAKAQECRNSLDELEPNVRAEYDEIEEKRAQYDEAMAQGTELGFPVEDVDLRTSEELDAELNQRRADLELNNATNGNVVETYERRKKEIEEMEQTVALKQKKIDKINRNIKMARDNWKPALEKLVTSIGGRFSAAFDRIGCAGEIRIHEHEDYEKWAIDILVKFRDTEQLQLLTGQRQSGGERSLTTILYLMSLTEEARAPFSLVDEINQGMDQRAERAVHNSMVEVTCKEDSAQYFLITPKLLADLKYHERMKVLCVYNGEWLPEERGIGNMMSMIEGYVKHQQGGGSQ